MVWINGENFLAMKRRPAVRPVRRGAAELRQRRHHGKPTTRIDFSGPVDGLEARGAWRSSPSSATASVARPPRSLAELVDFARRNPGRFTYPKPPNFHGTTFLKQVLLEASAERKPFHAPVVAERFAEQSTALWSTLDGLHPSLWRQGKQFPANNTTMRQMMADGELLVTLTFNNQAATEIAARRLPGRW
jgi:putative thiamine transport system substrate-binding protein